MSAPEDNTLSFLKEDGVPEVEDTVTDDGPDTGWKDGTYAGYDCRYREVVDPLGENVTTKRGSKYARNGDYIVDGLDEAPPGYHSQTIPRVVRVEDNNLVLRREAKKSTRTANKG